MAEYRPRLVPAHEALEVDQFVKDLYRQFLSKRPQLSNIVKGVRVEFGEDSNGEPAIWVTFIVEENPNPSSEEVALLNELASSVTSELLRKPVTATGWPYVGFRTSDHPQVSRGPA